ncbi:MAG: UvrD-helicase domain-containing protein, partial [Acidimicrobiales bacterium]
MSAFTPYDPAQRLAPGRTIIEASAGTGKTYTIAAEVTRLVALEGLHLGEILVVTFTRAATAELKSRVRDRMVHTLRALAEWEPATTTDRHLELLLGADEETRIAAVERLRDALTHFDAAQIFTIHGFAQRLMSHLGFRARLSEDLEPGEIDRLLLSQVASDLVVARFAHNPDNDELLTPLNLMAIGEAVVGTPDARIVPDAAEVEGLAHTRVSMAHDMKRELKSRLRAARQVTFDDGLIEARDALRDPEVGEAARALLKQRYAVALVDEAQDTDPTQWQIIRAVFDDSRLVVIGDPKQSIYSFRGADVESYLA